MSDDGRFKNAWTGDATDRAAIAHTCGMLAWLAAAVVTADPVASVWAAALGAALGWALAPLTRKP